MSTKEKKVVLLDPAKILVVHELRGRKIKPTKDEVKQMAASIESVGQEQPVKVRPLAEKSEAGHEYVTIFGSTRVDAIALLKEEGRKPNKVECEVVDLDDEQSFELTIRENNDRKETTPVDDAHNQQIFRERFGWTDQQIAKTWGMSQPRVSQLKRLLDASAKVQTAVAKGLVSADAAIELVQSGASPEQQNKVLEDAEERFGKEKLSRSQIKSSMAMLKELKVPAAEGNGSPSASSEGKTARTAKKIRDDFESDTVEGASSDDVTWKELCRNMIMYIDGKRTYKWLYEKCCEFREQPIMEEDIATDEDDASGDDVAA